MKREIVIDSDRISTIGMALLLLLSISSAVRDVVLLAHGRTTQPVTLYTLTAACVSLYLVSVLRIRLFRLAALLLGLGAAIRGFAFYAHLSPEAQRLAGINGLILSTTESMD